MVNFNFERVGKINCYFYVLCAVLLVLCNKELNVSLIDLPWENSIDASVTFGTHCVCVCVCMCDIHNKPKCSIM